jgi:hypothetical protein
VGALPDRDQSALHHERWLLERSGNHDRRRWRAGDEAQDVAGDRRPSRRTPFGVGHVRLHWAVTRSILAALACPLLPEPSAEVRRQREALGLDRACRAYLPGGRRALVVLGEHAGAGARCAGPPAAHSSASRPASASASAAAAISRHQIRPCEHAGSRPGPAGSCAPLSCTAAGSGTRFSLLRRHGRLHCGQRPADGLH